MRAAGGTVLRDLSQEIGAVFVRSSNANFAGTLEASGLVDSVGADFSGSASRRILLRPRTIRPRCASGT